MLDIPVFHDDQHGTAIVVLAALTNALRVVGKELPDVKIVMAGAGAAGTAVLKLLLTAGARHVISCDIGGAVYCGRPDLNESLDWIATHTNADGYQGNLAGALAGADVFIGVSAPGILQPEHVAKMARDPIVFAMANPTPEIMPDVAAPVAAVIATGRSDFPNQVNNLLSFPGIFRGALDVRARRITEKMKMAAAFAIAEIVSEAELSPEYVIPSVFDARVVAAVAKAVASAALEEGVARRTPSKIDGEESI
jgi:malate dehydrogenase (oxaloacetate-decarboxylating)